MMISRSFRLARYLAPLAFVAIAACGSDKSTGPGSSNLSTADRTALNTLLQNEAVSSAILDGEASGWGAAMLGLLAQNLQSIGTLYVNVDGSASLITPNGTRQNVIPVRGAVGVPAGSYRAFGGQLVLNAKFSDEPDENIVWTGIIAVNDLHEPTDVITTGVVQFETSAPSTSIASTSYNDELDETKAAFGSYIHIDGEQNTTYRAMSGSITIDNAAFAGSSTICPGIEQAPIIKSCTYTAGNLRGSFNFTAERIGSDETLTVPSTAVNIPAVRMAISVELDSESFQ